MSDKARLARNPFGFSLQGLKVSAFFAAGMAIGDDGINAAWDEKLRRKQAGRDRPAANGA